MNTRFQLVISAYIIFTLAFVLNFMLGGSGLMKVFVLLTGIAIAIFFGQFSRFHFFDASSSGFLKGFKTPESMPANMFVMGLGFPFALTGITGIFAVLRWPGPLFLYVFSVLTACISYAGFRYVVSSGLLDEKGCKMIKKHYTLLTIVLIIIGLCMIIFRSHFPIDFNITIRPSNNSRY